MKTAYIRPIDSPESMIDAIRLAGIIPFFHNPVTGWSIQDLTRQGCWFTDEEEGGCLGPWDWKIDAIREGDILYGKFFSNKAAFATPEWYRHLMNWRRSLPRMRMALGEAFKGTSQTDLLAKYLSPVLLSEIRKSRSLESSRVKDILMENVPQEVRAKVGGFMAKYLCPTVKKTACDNVLLYLEMGTWVVVGDFERVYKGPNLEYKGWQRSTLTTPEEILGTEPLGGSEPSWARKFLKETGGLGSSMPDCTPAESLELLIDHIVSVSGCTDRQTVLKFVK